MISRSSALGLALAAAPLLAPDLALAHEGSHVSGFAHGFAHPVGGLDHVLAMVAVGLFAANLGGRALWAVPLAFVAMMAAGGALGVQQIALPYVETGIALSVVALGLLVAFQVRWPVVAAAGLAALFAVFHGHAHGAEMPLDASGAAYAGGFMLATALLHIAGIGLGFLAGSQKRLVQLGGSGMALAGVALLAGAL